MTDEQAFLDALRANPADETTRLVYADWLDERGEAAKAEYLRLVVGLMPHYANVATDPPQAGRVRALAEQLPREWRASAAARFAVVLYGCEASHKINTIKLVREVTGFGLAEAAEFIETAPSRFPMRVTLENALGLRDHLGAGPNVRVQVHSDDLHELPRLGVYRIRAYVTVWGEYRTLLYEVPPNATVAAFQNYLTAVAGIPPEQAAEMAREGTLVAVADDLEPSQVPGRIAELQALLPPPDDDRGWSIELYTSYQFLPLPPTS
jgi:uncharacterized protein (TIGR02996 family)